MNKDKLLVANEEKKNPRQGPKLYEYPLMVISLAFGAWYIYYQGSLFYRDGIDPIGFIKALCNLFWQLLPAMVLGLPYTRFYYLVQLKSKGQKIRAIGFVVITLLIRKLL